MFNTANYERNANQNYNEVPLHAGQNAIIKKSINNWCWRRCEEKWTYLHCRWESKLVQPLWKTVWKFPRKLKIELPSDPAGPLLGIHLDKTIIQKDTRTIYVHNNTIYNSQNTETQTDKDVVQINSEILLSRIKEWNNAICTNTEATRDYHIKWSETERHTNGTCYHFYVESKIGHKRTCLWSRNRITDVEKRLMVAKRKGFGEGMEWGVRVSRCKLL